MTLFISTVTLVVATLLGLVIAIMQMSRFRVARIVALSVGEIVAQYADPGAAALGLLRAADRLHVRIDAPVRVDPGLSLYSAVFISEVFRAGIQTVPVGHREAAQVLGLTTTQSFVRDRWPAGHRSVLPPLAANFVQLIKYSSLASVVSVSEVTRRGMELSSSTFRPLEIFTFIAVIYFVICWPLTHSIRIWESRLARR